MKYTIKKVKGIDDPLFNDIAQVRTKVFVEEDNYPTGSIISPLDRGAMHFVAIDADGNVMGSVSANIKSSKEEQLPIENYMGEVKGADGSLGEICKLAVLDKYRTKPVALYLMVAAYDHLISEGVAGIMVWSISSKSRNVKLYSKFGFKPYGDEFVCCNSENAIPFFLDVAKDSIYDAEKSSLHKRFTESYKKHLVE
jgi:predicted GNAT family N-acyltransferase